MHPGGDDGRNHAANELSCSSSSCIAGCCTDPAGSIAFKPQRAFELYFLRSGAGASGPDDQRTHRRHRISARHNVRDRATGRRDGAECDHRQSPRGRGYAARRWQRIAGHAAFCCAARTGSRCGARRVYCARRTKAARASGYTTGSSTTGARCADAHKHSAGNDSSTADGYA